MTDHHKDNIFPNSISSVEYDTNPMQIFLHICYIILIPCCVILSISLIIYYTEACRVKVMCGARLWILPMIFFFYLKSLHDPNYILNPFRARSGKYERILRAYLLIILLIYELIGYVQVDDYVVSFWLIKGQIYPFF